MAPFSWLVFSLPCRFYNWFVLLLVFFVIWLGRDWGPMLIAERAARTQPFPPDDATGSVAPGAPAALALVPLAVLVVGVGAGLFVGGGGLDRPLSLSSLVQALGAADAASVFVLATAVASLVAMLLSAVWRGARSRAGAADEREVRMRDAFLHGMERMFLPALILVFAWTLNGVIRLSGVGGLEGAPPTMVTTIGAVPAGAVFGDHCSPISDTTVVSAFSSDCEVMAHVRTQLPYALLAAVVALLLGYVPAGLGVPSWLLLPVGAVVLWAFVRFAGRPSQPQDRGT